MEAPTPIPTAGTEIPSQTAVNSPNVDDILRTQAAEIAKELDTPESDQTINISSEEQTQAEADRIADELKQGLPASGMDGETTDDAGDAPAGDAEVPKPAEAAGDTIVIDQDGNLTASDEQPPLKL